ncbi:putative transporter [Teratosphaeria destructans]|uniref:Cercosporin MFS transporter CTB4 n=1 Tax=Teratosphaeria destructans TaxID=418781 RepID=A0A9W7SHP5_9PEZI|nr:putative transporter [Teratosphaeria destructans]
MIQREQPGPGPGPGPGSSASDKLSEKLDHAPTRLGASSDTTSPQHTPTTPSPLPSSPSAPSPHPSSPSAPSPSATDHVDPYLVDWHAGDPRNPRNWSTPYKGFITFQLGMLALSASLGSSIIAPAESVIASTFGVSEELTVLAVSLYVLGFAFGPLLWAPVSEVYGRKVSMLPPLVALALFSLGTAVAPDAATVFVTRFFGGVFGSAPVSNVSAALGDLYEPKARGIAVTFYAVCVVGGPTIGPVIGAALTVHPRLGWRWTEYVEAIWVATVTLMAFCLMPELYGPVLLKREARRRRRETGDDRWSHPHEAAKIRPSNILTKHVSRPLTMFVTEPMVTSIAIYASFVYALLYMTLEVFPYVYGRGPVLAHPYRFSPVLSTLPFLGLFVGVFAAMLINLLHQPRYARAVARNRGRAVPEARLPPMLIGGALFVIGLFWFGWTATDDHHWAIPTVATAFIGAGFNVIFQQCINFLVDTYALYAASAVSANTFLRLPCSPPACPLTPGPCSTTSAVGPACSILGAVACLALPVPLLFMRYGARLRRMSRFAPVED